MKQELLNENNYKKTKRKIIFISLILFVLGLIFGGGLITLGLNKQKEINLKYSEESKEKVAAKVEEERQVLEVKRQQLVAKGIVYDIGADYTDGEAYDLYIITEAMDPSFNHCKNDEYLSNSLTSKYCTLKNQLLDLNENNKESEMFFCIPFYMFGGFVFLSFSMFAFYTYFHAKGREIAAFKTQQVMPLAQEGIEKMAPTVGNVANEVAKGISSGINEGKQDEENK